jgi:hypothetical protein
MRGKVAKHIRKAAEIMTRNSGVEESYLQHEGTGTIILEPMCTRAVYQRMKAKHSVWLQKGSK